jgi:hypothetical protein
LATVTFVAVFGIGSLVLGGDVGGAAQFAASALIVTPLIWGLGATPAGRMAYVKGACAGGIIGAVVWVLPLLVAAFTSVKAVSAGGSHWGPLILAMGGFVGTLIALLIGASLGLVIVWSERKRDQSTGRDSSAEDR